MRWIALAPIEQDLVRRSARPAGNSGRGGVTFNPRHQVDHAISAHALAARR